MRRPANHHREAPSNVQPYKKSPPPKGDTEDVSPVVNFLETMETIARDVPQALAEFRAELHAIKDRIDSDPRWKQGRLRTDQAADYLSMSRRTFERLSKEFKIPCTKIGQIKLYSTADLDAFAEKYKAPDQ